MEQVLYTSSILLPLGILLRMSLRLLYGVRGPQADDPIYQIIYVASWVLTIMPLTVFIVASTLWLSTFLLLVSAFSGLELVLARRAMQRRSAWSVLSETVGESQVTLTSLKSHQVRFAGIVGRSFRKIVSALNQGVSLPAAIGKHRHALPADAQAYAAIDALDSESQPLGAKETAKPHDHPILDTLQNAAGQQLYQRLSYLGTVLFIMVAIVLFVAIKIIPSYEAIFSDFELDLPPVTIYLISFFQFFVQPATSVLVGYSFFMVSAATLIVALLYLADVPVLRPLTDRVFFSRHRALILRLLAITAERGHSFQQTTQQLCHGNPCYPSWYVRRKLSRIYRLISSGQNWKDALCKTTIIKKSDFPTLETAEKAGNLAWALRLVADQKLRTMVFRWSAFEQVAFPLAVMMLGMAVLFICVGLFVPLVELINGLTG